MRASTSRRPSDIWVDREGQSSMLARNVVLEYAAIAVNLLIGIVMLPFNVHHLGQSAYGLWVLVTSLTTYFSLLDLGYGSAQVKFTARYRAQRDPDALNEIASTLCFLFGVLGAAAFAAALLMAAGFGHFFKLAPDQIRTGRQIFLIASFYIAAGFPFSVFGGVVNGFQRYYLNNIIAMCTSVAVALVNVVVLSMGYGIVHLVAATSAVKLVSFVFYRRTAYAAFPLLSVRPALVRVARLREVTGFSIFLLVLDIAVKINYSADVIVIGAFMTTAAIAIWAVAVRVVDVAALMTGAITRFLFPAIVESATKEQLGRLQVLLVQGTRLSLAMVIPISCVLAILARAAVIRWMGPRFAESVPIIWILSGVVVSRIGTTTASTVLKGCERHKFLAANCLAVAVLNFGLSWILVRWWGLIGVAAGTLLPVAIISWGVLFPAACRRVGLSTGAAIRSAIWPAVWPIAPAAAALAAARPFIGTSLALIVSASVATGLTYAALFLGAALAPEEREWYVTRLRIVSRRALPVTT